MKKFIKTLPLLWVTAVLGFALLLGACTTRSDEPEDLPSPSESVSAATDGSSPQPEETQPAEIPKNNDGDVDFNAEDDPAGPNTTKQSAAPGASNSMACGSAGTQPSVPKTDPQDNEDSAPGETQKPNASSSTTAKSGLPTGFDGNDGWSGFR